MIKAVIQVKSGGNPKAVSKKGAYRLMQIRHKVWVKELKKAGIITTKQCLFDPEKNVKAWSINHGHGYTSLVSGCIT